jgi:intracellular septation protein
MKLLYDIFPILLLFVAMGFVNLGVADSYPEDIWVDFRLFAPMGLTLLFVLGQGVVLARHIDDHPNPEGIS